MPEQQTIAEFRKLAHQEILDLFDGDLTLANRWLSSPIRALGNHPPISLLSSERGIQKVRNVVRKWEEGAVS